MLVMSRLVTHKEGRAGLSDIHLAVGKFIRRGGAQLADCLKNNVKTSLVHFHRSLARLFRVAPALVAASALYTGRHPKNLNAPFLNLCDAWMFRRVTANTPVGSKFIINCRPYAKK